MRFLPEKPLRRCGSVSTQEEKVMNRCQACTLSEVIKSSKLVIPQSEVTVSPFHVGRFRSELVLLKVSSTHPTPHRTQTAVCGCARHAHEAARPLPLSG